MDPKAIDDLAGANAKAPRVTLDDIESRMRNVWYTNANNCGPTLVTPEEVEQLKLTTLCFVLMQNGYLVIGHSTPASPENFDPKLGRQLAYDQCIRQLWPILGYELRSQFMAGPIE